MITDIKNELKMLQRRASTVVAEYELHVRGVETDAEWDELRELSPNTKLKKHWWISFVDGKSAHPQ